MKIINLPFQGFYHSYLEAIIDDFLEAEACHYWESNPVLDVCTYADLLDRASDFEGMRKAIANAYVHELNKLIQEEDELDTNFKFESLVSPREYNFETDKVFAYVRQEVVQEMFDRTTPMTLAQVIQDRHTSRSGFVSFYSNDMQEWQDKPLAEWDANELCTLLLAYLEDNVDGEWEEIIADRLMTLDHVFLESYVNWTKFENSAVKATRNTL